jgi:uncharacterized membrane protein YesL
MRIFTPNFEQEGPGVEKNEPLKEDMPLFFQLFFMRFWDIIKLNFVFLLYCLPIITIAPALGAMTSVTMSMVQRKHIYIFSDFREAFKENWKQSLISGFISFTAFAFLSISLLYYLRLAQEKHVFYFVFFLCLFLAVLLGLSLLYVFPLITTVSLSINDIFKNSILLCIVCIKDTLFGVLVYALIIGFNIFFFPLTFPLFLLLTFSTLSFITCFITLTGINKFIIK